MTISDDEWEQYQAKEARKKEAERLAAEKANQPEPEEDEDSKYSEARLDVSGTNIYFGRAGKGPINVLFLHDMIGSYSIDFQRILKGFSHEKYTLVAWDAPGYGRSRPPDRDNSPGYHFREAKLAYELMEKLGLLPFSIMGHGDAGPTALIMAHNHKDNQNINRLLLWGTSSYVSGKQNFAYNFVLRDTSLWADKKKQPFLDIYGEEYFNKIWIDHCDAKIDWYKDKKSKGDICSDLLPEIFNPVLLIYPEHDYYYDEEEMDDLEEALPNSCLMMGDDMYHQMHLQNYDFFKKIAEGYLDADDENMFEVAEDENKRIEEEYEGVVLDEEWLGKYVEQISWRDMPDASIKGMEIKDEDLEDLDAWDPAWDAYSKRPEGVKVKGEKKKT